MFNKEKGFGFITGEDGQDYFFHFSALQVDGYKEAAKGEAVQFDVEQSDRGPRAAHIQKL